MSALGIESPTERVLGSVLLHPAKTDELSGALKVFGKAYANVPLYDFFTGSSDVNPRSVIDMLPSLVRLPTV